MKLIQVIRKLLLKPQSEPHYEYVRETAEAQRLDTRSVAAEAGTEPKAPPAEVRIEEIAFSPHGDLESYVRELNLPKEAIERWISAGVLLPEETKVAAQMIRILNKNRQVKN